MSGKGREQSTGTDATDVQASTEPGGDKEVGQSTQNSSRFPRWLLFGCLGAGCLGLVAVVVLASIAIPNFLNMALRAKNAEAPSNLDAIRMAELSYSVEFGEALSAGPCPPVLPGRDPAPFEGDCAASFAPLGWAPDGPVRCQYTVVADEGPGGQGDFLATGRCDADGDGVEVLYEASRDRAATRITSERIY
jgi:hypothetical protein